MRPNQRRSLRPVGAAPSEFAFPTADYDKGPRTIVVRLVDGGLKVAWSFLTARFQ